MTNPNESNELIETIKEVRESLYKVSGSALLAGEKCKSEDKAIIYGLVCNANNLLLSVIDNLAAQPQSVHPDALEALKNYQQADESGVMVLVSRQALDEAIRALIEPLSADEHKENAK